LFRGKTAGSAAIRRDPLGRDLPPARRRFRAANGIALKTKIGMMPDPVMPISNPATRAGCIPASAAGRAQRRV
jgi:hypothetical protein